MCGLMLSLALGFLANAARRPLLPVRLDARACRIFAGTSTG
jgi:hypothetical protein